MEIIKDIKTSVDTLSKFTQMGILEPVLSDSPVSFRYLVVRDNYKIIYFIDEEKAIINIATVFFLWFRPRYGIDPFVCGGL